MLFHIDQFAKILSQEEIVFLNTLKLQTLLVAPMNQAEQKHPLILVESVKTLQVSDLELESVFQKSSSSKTVIFLTTSKTTQKKTSETTLKEDLKNT